MHVSFGMRYPKGVKKRRDAATGELMTCGEKTHKHRILHEWSFHMKFIKRAFGECKIRFIIIIAFNIGFYRLQSTHIFNENLHFCHGRRQERYALISGVIQVCLRFVINYEYDFYN